MRVELVLPKQEKNQPGIIFYNIENVKDDLIEEIMAYYHIGEIRKDRDFQNLNKL